MDHEVPKFCFIQDITTHTKPNRMPLQENFRSHESDGREDDLKIISQWVRKELFVKVKFLYDAKKPWLWMETSTTTSLGTAN